MVGTYRLFCRFLIHDSIPFVRNTEVIGAYRLFCRFLIHDSKPFVRNTEVVGAYRLFCRFLIHDSKPFVRNTEVVGASRDCLPVSLHLNRCVCVMCIGVSLYSEYLF